MNHLSIYPYSPLLTVSTRITLGHMHATLLCTYFHYLNWLWIFQFSHSTFPLFTLFNNKFIVFFRELMLYYCCLIFLFSLCPLVGTRGLGTCLVIDLVVSPGHVGKFPFCMALINVDDAKSKHHVWYYCTNSSLFVVNILFIWL